MPGDPTTNKRAVDNALTMLEYTMQRPSHIASCARH